MLAPFLVLSVFEGEIISDTEPGQIEELAAQRWTWLANGKRGIILLLGIHLSPRWIAIVHR